MEQVGKWNNSSCSILLCELVAEKADKRRQRHSIFEELELRGSTVIWHPFSVGFRNIHGGNSRDPPDPSFKVPVTCGHSVNTCAGNHMHLSSSTSFRGLTAFFLFVNNFHCTDVQSVYQSPTERHPGCFQVLATMNHAALNIRVRVSVWTSVFSSFG